MKVSLCSICKIESRYPDCGAKPNDFNHKMGFGVTSCKKFVERK